jgi:hypothetical protein
VSRETRAFSWIQKIYFFNNILSTSVRSFKRKYFDTSWRSQKADFWLINTPKQPCIQSLVSSVWFHVAWLVQCSGALLHVAGETGNLTSLMVLGGGRENETGGIGYREGREKIPEGGDGRGYWQKSKKGAVGEVRERTHIVVWEYKVIRYNSTCKRFKTTGC